MFEEYSDTLKIADVTSYLGVSYRTILNEIKAGKLQAYKVGKQYIIFKKDMLDYMRTKKVQKVT